MTLKFIFRDPNGWKCNAQQAFVSLWNSCWRVKRYLSVHASSHPILLIWLVAVHTDEFQFIVRLWWTLGNVGHGEKLTVRWQKCMYIYIQANDIIYRYLEQCFYEWQFISNYLDTVFSWGSIILPCFQEKIKLHKRFFSEWYLLSLRRDR